MVFKGKDLLDGVPFQQQMRVVQHPEADVLHRLTGDSRRSAHPIGHGHRAQPIISCSEPELANLKIFWGPEGSPKSGFTFTPLPSQSLPTREMFYFPTL